MRISSYTLIHTKASSAKRDLFILTTVIRGVYKSRFAELGL